MAEYRMRVPDLGEGIAEVELLAWHVAVGEEIAADQAVADLMTDKATVEIPSPVAGIVRSLGGEPGQLLAVGAELICIEVAAAGDQVVAGQAPEASGPDRESPDVVAAAALAPATAAGPAMATRAGKVRAAPAVRLRARQLGIDLASVRGSGVDGRILHEDLDALLVQGRDGAACPPAAPVARPADAGEREIIPLGGLRRQISRKLDQRDARVAQFSYVEEVDVTELEALRHALNESRKADELPLTLLPFVIRALVLAVDDHPQLNVHFDDAGERLIRFGKVHLGVAVHTESGLMAPVLPDAGAFDLQGLARALSALAEAARAGTLAREQLGGATISLTSLGALGGIASTPLVVPPQVAIVGINRIVDRVCMRDGQLGVRKLMNLSSSFDHRIIDGMDAAQFIQAMRRRLEVPSLLFAR